ncbi:4Fe-4S dicluster domain-containing protein [Desulfopila sp. IMCC35008]|uniref:4Fe-4S dicluster domain-containing protein n=1 Tax=Desulfopila sp. IMCC35008 TaxID=2653858 RepID=UPI0013CFC62B|nr:4Fe-4S dicluster domain-containing protein [Desulfopila sp. IMCC35008]
MTFNVLLVLSVLICLAGVFIRCKGWFTQTIFPSAQPAPPGERASAAFKGVISTLLSNKLLTIISSFFKDLLFQQRVFDKSSLRWTAHTLIFFGFISLLLMHGMESIFSEKIFSDYMPTLNPYLFLRNLFGLMVLVGVGLAVYRRILFSSKRLKSYPSDWIALILVGGVALSGMLYEGTRITSYSVFMEMVDEYGAFEDEELVQLESYWVAANGLVSPNVKTPVAAEMVELGREANSMSCIECHTANGSAFASFTLRPVTRIVSGVIGDRGALGFFWLLHIGFCLTLLAWLPFSKMFHIIAAPINLFIRSIMGKESDETLNALNRQMVGLSACTHCGSCSVECSSSMFYESFNNDFILPSEKIQFLKNIAAGEQIGPATRKKLQEGLYVCTSCDRCTDICPSGINLREIFIQSRYALLEGGSPEKALLSHFSFPLALARYNGNNHLAALKAVEDLFKKTFQKLTDIVQPISLATEKKLANVSYQSCYSCQRCTNICPVVRSYDDPVAKLDLLPHQLIFMLGIGNSKLAMGSQMIWSCSTCYLCQEHCPNQVELTDIFYGLKNEALKKIDSGDRS